MHWSTYFSPMSFISAQWLILLVLSKGRGKGMMVNRFILPAKNSKFCIVTTWRKCKITEERVFCGLAGLLTQIPAIFQKSGTIVAGSCCFYFDILGYFTFLSPVQLTPWNEVYCMRYVRLIICPTLVTNR